MTKHYCDRCEEELREHYSQLQIIEVENLRWINTTKLCDKCMTELKFFLSPLKGAKDVRS